MSRTTAGIMRINQELDKISGLDGIVADKIEELEKAVKTMVSDILNNNSEASLFNYEGQTKIVTPKETFELNLNRPEGGKIKFVKGKKYKAKIEDGIEGYLYYVEGEYKYDAVFDENDFLDSFNIIKVL